ncbi:MAG: LamG domain-containing protein [Candidatus Pacebacteria bacterium]|nr:LamG domain-containing protein [Candidatus Paceibacterota bacterium]
MKKNTSFTLIELLVVIVIIGVIAGVIIVTTTSFISKANIAKLKVFEESVANNLAANMVSRWKLDGNANDAWGSNNGTWSGATSGDNRSANYRPESECVSGQCLDFDGTDDYIDCGNDNSLNITNKITISAWVKLNKETNYQSIVRKANDGGNQYVLYITSEMYPYFNSFDTSWHTYTGTISVEEKAWTHIVVSYNGTKVNFYINSIDAGVFDGSFSLKSPSSPTALFIGGDSYYLNGSIDDVRIYNAALSSSQIKQNYIAGLNSLLSNGNISSEEYNQRIEVLSSR